MKALFTIILATIILCTGFAAADPVDNAIIALIEGPHEVRQPALEVLAESGTAATERLLAALPNDSVIVRIYILRALREVADPTARETIAHMLQNDPALLVRAAAAEAMAAYRDDDALNKLKQAASEDTADYVRAASTLAIASVRRKASVDLLVWLLKNDDLRVRRVASESLRRLTMQNYGTNYEQWKLWWLDSRDEFVVIGAAAPEGEDDD